MAPSESAKMGGMEVRCMMVVARSQCEGDMVTEIVSSGHQCWIYILEATPS